MKEKKMDKKRHFASLSVACIIAILANLSIEAQPSSTYYQSIDGLKKEALKKQLRTIISNHTKISYDGLKTAYPYVYYVDEANKGTKYATVYDLCSDEVYLYSSTGLWNREHVVPKSWWGGGSNNAYSDIVSVIPSYSKSNSDKSNYPPGMVDKSRSYKNSGRQWVGYPLSGYGGSASRVWEPYDEYKGDYARIYMYVATCYSNLSWDEYNYGFKNGEWPTMDPWMYNMLLEWHNSDPVSEKEKQINDDIFAQQGNRNPFIDYPALADYIWNSEYWDEEFDLSTATLYAHVDGTTPATSIKVVYDANGGSAAPAASVVYDGNVTITEQTPYRANYTFISWNTESDGSGIDYQPGQVCRNVTTTIRLYAQWEFSGTGGTDQPTGSGEWVKVTAADQLEVGGKVVIVAAESDFALSTTQNSYNRGQASVVKEGNTVTLTSSVAQLTLGEGTVSGSWSLYDSVNNGYLYAASSSNNHLKTGTSLDANGSWTISVTKSGIATVTAQGSNSRNMLLYNSSASLFSCYSAKQDKLIVDISLYVPVNTGTIALTSITLNHSSLELTEGDLVKLVATVEPADATNPSLVWTSSDESVATVINGTINAIKAGETVITVSSKDGTCMATCNVTVNPYPTFTVTLGDTHERITETAGNSGVELPTRSKDGYTFEGWCPMNMFEADTEIDDDLFESYFYPTSDIVLFPVWSYDVQINNVWELVTNLSSVTQGIYALLTDDGHAFNGSINDSGHGQATSNAFEFDENGIALSAPANTVELTFTAVSGGFKMYNSDHGYLYSKAAKSGNLAWDSSENSCWCYQSSNWTYKANGSLLRSNNNSFRTYGNNHGSVLKLAHKTTASKTFYSSLLGEHSGVTGDANDDGVVDVNDVTLVVSYVLGTISEGTVFVFEQANVVAETESVVETIDVSDITAIVSIIMRGDAHEVKSDD